MKKIVILLILISVTCVISYGQDPIENEAYFIRKMDYARGFHELLSDVNNDGRDEFVCAKGKRVSVGPKKTKFVGRVYVYTWIMKKQISEIEVDVDEFELILGDGKFVREWVSREFDGIEALAVGDANNNGRNEIIITTPEIISGYERNEKGHYVLAYRFEVPDNKGRIFNLFVGDTNGDKKKEMVISEIITRKDIDMGSILICKLSLLSWDGKSFVKKWESNTFESFDCLPSVSIADVEGDNREEILVYLPTEGAHAFLWEYNPVSKQYESKPIRENIGGGADINGDGCNELVRGSSGMVGNRYRIKKLELVKWKDEKVVVKKMIDLSMAGGWLRGPIGYNITGEKEVNIVIDQEHVNVLYGAK